MIIEIFQELKEKALYDSKTHTYMYVNDTLIDLLFTFLRPAQESFTYMEASPLPVKDCKL
jgi:hypothetical protein